MNILVVEDQWVYRPAILQQITDIEPNAVISEACSLKETFERLEQAPHTQLIILDLKLDDSAGVDTLKNTRDWCIGRNISPRIVVLSADDDVSLAREVLKNHSTGFILKQGSREEFEAGLRTTLSGRIHVPKHLLDALLESDDEGEDRKGGAVPIPESGFPESFTDREKEVCRVIVGGAITYRAMARKMARTQTKHVLSENTVRIFVRSAANKLGIMDNVKVRLLLALAKMKIRGSENGQELDA